MDIQALAILPEEAGSIQAIVSELGISPSIYTDYRDLLLSKEVEAVAICTPNALHAEMTLAAAEAGKHVFCEKPMAITLEDCHRIRECIKRAGVKYLIGYHRRFNPLYQYAKNLLDTGQLGDPVYIESDYIHHIPGDWAIWEWLGKESIAGSIFHAGCGHCVDLLRFFGGEIVEVSCYKDVRMPRRIQVDTEDLAVASFRFRSGALGKVTLLVGGIAPFQFNFVLYGTRGTVLNNRVWLDSTPRFDQSHVEESAITLPFGWIPDNLQTGVAETWKTLDDHFIQMILDDKSSINDVDSAFATSRTVFAALQAAQEGRSIRLEQ